MASRASLLFRKRIKELRKSRGWTQEMAAERCALDYKLYQFYELGIKTNPGLETLEKIAQGFGVSLAELFTFSTSAKTRRGK